MKLLFYINTLSHGGAERVISNLATEMAVRGHDCTVVTSFPCEWEYSVGLKVKRINLYPNKLEGNKLVRNIKLIHRLRRFIHSAQPDLLVTFMGEPNSRAIPVTVGTKTKVIMSVRNDPKREYCGRLNTWIAKYIMPFADGMVFQTEDAKQWFPEKIRNKSVVIFNPVDKLFFDIKRSECPHDIIATGRLTEQKNHSLLIRAFAQIADQISDNLYIYGSGDSSQLEELVKTLGIENRVFLPGVSKNIPEILSKAKLYVLSSDFEGMPNALMEAMAVGVPCISTNCPCGGPKSLFTKDMYHYLTPVGDIDAMSCRILELIQNSFQREAHGKACKEAAKAFAPDSVNDQWEKYLVGIR